MKIRFKTILFLISIVFINTIAFAQQTPSAQLDTFFTSLHKFGQLNGNVLIAEKGNIVYKSSLGYSNFENNTLNNDTTGLSLSSVSKVFTSTAILQLRDKGKFNLDEPIAKYLPDFPYADITIRNLLSHTSGLPDYQLYEELMNKNPAKIFTNKDVLPALKIWKKPLAFKPGEKWNYSNTNFCLLALLVEKASGLTFQKYLQRYIFNPAGMPGTYFATDPMHVNNKRRALNYEFPTLYTSKYQNVDSLKKYRWRLYNASGFVGQGNIITTTGDMLKFDKALYSGTILKPATLNEAFTPTQLNSGANADAGAGMGQASYGLGWFIFADTTNGKIVFHTGGQPGALSIFVRNITKKQTVIMFDNTFNKSLYTNGVNAMAILNGKAASFRKISTSQAYGSTLAEKGIDEAFCKLLALEADSAYYVSEDDMNALGLNFLYEATFANHNELSLEVLKLNTLFFPNSFNTYDSYGEALAKAGKKHEAILMYKKSIELNPASEEGKQALKRLLSTAPGN